MNESAYLDHEEAHKLVLDLLQKREVLSPIGRLIIERYMKSWQCDALAALTETHQITENSLAKNLAEGFGIQITHDLLRYQWAPESLAALPFIRARSWEMIMVTQSGGEQRLVVANPAHVGRIQQVHHACPAGFTLSVGERSDIVRAIDELYPLAAQLPSLHAD